MFFSYLGLVVFLVWFVVILEMDQSLRIEAKVLVFYIVEKGRKYSLSLYLSDGMVDWYAKEMEDCLKKFGKMVDYQTRREGDKVFML